MAAPATEIPNEIAELGFEEVRVVRLEPGDVIVLMAPKRFTMEEADMAREQVAAFFAGHRIVVLDDGLSLEVLREGDVDG